MRTSLNPQIKPYKKKQPRREGEPRRGTEVHGDQGDHGGEVKSQSERTLCYSSSGLPSPPAPTGRRTSRAGSPPLPVGALGGGAGGFGWAGFPGSVTDFDDPIPRSHIWSDSGLVAFSIASWCETSSCWNIVSRSWSKVCCPLPAVRM